MSKTHTIVLASALALLLIVLELVRRRRLREEYSWLWLFAALTYLLMAVWPGLYRWIARTIGATNEAMAFTFLGLYCLIFISIQFSVQLSRLTTQIKDLAQHIAILDSELKGSSEASESDDGSGHSEDIKRLFDQNQSLARQIAILANEMRGVIDERDRQDAIAQLVEQQERG